MNRRRFLALSTVGVSVAKAGVEESAPLISFGLMTDVQYADVAPKGERHYRESIPKLKAAVADVAQEDLPFTLHLGDLIDRDFSSFGAVLPLFEGLGHPVRHLLGNHDYDVADGEKARITEVLGMPRDYYAFRSSGVRFVMLDTNEVSTYKNQEGCAADREAEVMMKKMAAKNANNAKPWNGGVSVTQLAWLEKELSEADKAGEPVILCGHHPLLPAAGHQAWNSGAIVAVIDAHACVRAYFCGHNHAGAQTISKGVPYITFKSILHEPSVTAYSVVRLCKDRLVIEGRGREKSRVIPLRAMA